MRQKFTKIDVRHVKSIILKIESSERVYGEGFLLHTIFVKLLGKWAF